MRAFCAILLMGVVTYVHAAIHQCDHLALNLEGEKGEKDMTDRDVRDGNNGWLRLSTFLEIEKISFNITHATPNESVSGMKFCSGATFGSHCGGVEYTRVIKNKNANPQSVADIRIESTIIGWDKKEKKAYKYTMTIKGADPDDFIFVWDETIDVEAEILNESGQKIEDIVLTPAIKEYLKKPFALFSANDGNYTYITCDKSQTWTARRIKSFEKDIEKLRSVINNQIQSEPIDSSIPSRLSEMIENIVAPAA